MNPRPILLCLCAGLLLSSVAISADSHPCAREVDAQARLACYDRAFPPVAKALGAAPVQRSEAELRQEFGLTTRELEERKPEADRTQRIGSIEATVTDVRAAPGGQRVLTLDNGQVWRLTEGGTRGPLKNGDAVVVRRALMGSYILVTPGGVGLRARRLQ